MDSEAELPCPRFAHQFEYDPSSEVCLWGAISGLISLNSPYPQIHYLFGGNPGLPRQPKLRLADFWALQLERADLTELVRRCCLALRQQAFRELAIKVRVIESRKFYFL